MQSSHSISGTTMFNTWATRISSFDYKTKEKFEWTERSTTQFHFAFIKNIQLNKGAIKGWWAGGRRAGGGGGTIVSPKKNKSKN